MQSITLYFVGPDRDTALRGFPYVDAEHARIVAGGMKIFSVVALYSPDEAVDSPR